MRQDQSTSQVACFINVVRLWRVRMNKLAMSLLLTAAFVLPTHGEAATIYDTFVPCNLGVDSFCAPGGITYDGGGGWSYGKPFFSDVDAGNAFTLGTDSYTLDSISLVLNHTEIPGTGNLVDVWLMSDLSGAPGSILESFQVAAPDSTTNGSVSPPQQIAPLVVNSTLHPLL